MEEFLGARRALVTSAEPGLEAARALSALTDEAVRELSLAASSLLDERWAIVALGSWGSGVLLPRSDLDILILSEAPESSLKPFVEAVLYPLWDAGLEVGHQVRSPRQQIRAIRDDLKTCTSILTGRPLAGDTEWAKEVVSRCAREAHKRRRRLLTELHARPRPGSPYLLEPDLKEDAGGRRDYDELVWSASLLSGVHRTGISSLVRAGLLTEGEYGRLEDAAAIIAAARWRLHAKDNGDTLTHEAAPAFRDDAELVHLALADTALILTRARARMTTRTTATETARTPAGPREIFEALDAGTSSLPALEAAASEGRLESLMPGFARLMAVRRPGLGHRLTVGAHCLYAATLIAERTDDRSLLASRHGAGGLRSVQVAALVHDAAKVEGGAGHAERGAEPALETARRFGLDADGALETADLVRLHLALVETASREDLDDEDAILRCAARVGRRELVPLLHLLTAADSRATGPSTWTSWMAALVSTLVARLDTALSPDIDGAGVALQGERVRAAALASIPAARDGERAFVEAAPLRYLSAREPDEVLRHAALVAELGADHEGPCVRVVVADGTVPGTHDLTIVAMDHPDLLARLAGAIAVAGLDILSVDAYGTTGHIALDSFVVRSATEAPTTPTTLASLPTLIASALEDRLELASRLALRRRHYPVRSVRATTVEVAPSGWDTTVVVETPDRPGLLHDLAAAVSASGLDIRWARVQTLTGVARDIFHVVGPDGGPVDDPGVLGHLAMRLREAV